MNAGKAIAAFFIVPVFYLTGILIGAFIKALAVVLLLSFIYMILAFFGVVPPVDYIPILPLV